MALPNSSFVSFVVGVLVLAYLSTFVVFAVIRILFGVSIQRLWWSGLRRIAFTPREGIRIDIRGVRLSLHRPTFAQPTWISVVITELKVIVDLKALGSKTVKKSRWTHWRNSSLARLASPSRPSTPTRPSSSSLPEDDTDSEDNEVERSRTWEKLTDIKEKIKRLHRQIHWIRLVDVVAANTSVTILEVGSVELASFTMAVDTRRKTVDRSRLFQHRRAQSEGQRPAEWIFSARSLLFSPDGKESSEILDHATLNVHGLLYQHLDGLRDASIALKLGRVSLPYDDLTTCLDRIEQKRRAAPRREEKETSLLDIVEELEKPGSKEEAIVQTVSDSKEFVASILRGIQEIQFAVSFVGLSKRMQSLQPGRAPVYLNASMKEVGIDLLRLDSNSPAHLMYFNRNDVAHQALLTAISISVGIDDGQEHPERLLYVPMATATLKSTLPSKTIQMSRQKNVAERNTNMLFANLVITSPSIDLDPKHLPLMLAVLQNRRAQPRPQKRQRPKHHLLSRLLPKANIKCSIHEPVVRVSLPCMELERRDTGDFDLLISAMSSMSLDIESSHTTGGELHYSLACNYRLTSHQLYYQTASAEKHNLLLTDTLELKLQVSASPELAVVATGNVQTFSVFLVRPEISEGLRQIVAQLRSDSFKPAYSTSRSPPQPNFLRKLPSWLLHVQLKGSDFNFEVAGPDPDVSQNARGAAIHLESWTAEYKANRHDDLGHRPSRRRAPSRAIQGDELFLRPLSPSPSRRSLHAGDTDGRRLAIHTHGLEAFVIESSDTWEAEPFMSLPRYEVAFTTSTDQQGPILHINSFAKALYMHYSLYRHYAVGVATVVLRKTFARPSSAPIPPTSPSRLSPTLRSDSSSPNLRPELIAFDFRAAFVQLKATMPADPPLMIQIFSVEIGRHRWASPFVKARLFRLYAEAPKMKKIWARVMSFRNLRIDYRQSRRKYGTNIVEDRSIDVASDAIRVAVPHQLVVHRIFDNAVNVIKTVEQLHHRFNTGTDEDILEKKPEGPKRVPKITLRTQAFVFEIEDSLFEWKLGNIYLQGLQEQKQRMAREEAFELKVRKIREAEARRVSNKFRPKSTYHGRGRHKRKSSEEIPLKARSKSEEPFPKRGRSTGTGETRRLRYDVEGTCGLSDTARRSIDDARDKLHHFNAQSWKKRITAAYRFQKYAMRDMRSVIWGMDDLPEDLEQNERILAIPERPSLMAVLISDLNISLDKPSFPLQDYPQFLHKMGKGMPYDMQYGLLIPMHVKIAMGEARMTLRDYPLPLLHVPAIRAGQSPRLPSLSMETDFVIAEEFRGAESLRHVQVAVVPPDKHVDGIKQGGLSVDVRRTVSAVKTYSDVSVEINTSQPTRITWGTSYQPAIQDMMQVVENFTKPAVDPSERVGFWDKIRLSFHSRVNVAWKGDGDVHLVLKGSRDPYHLTGSGAGFVMCWRNDVRWSICQDRDPKKFMTVDSGEYVLAVPDFSSYARRALDRDVSDSSSVNSTSSYEQGGKFKKTMMKLSGNVRWQAGLVFERNAEEGGRSFEFIPHYQVVLKSPEFAKPGDGLPYDGFRGFRSHHIHLSVAIVAPVDRDWTVTNLRPSSNYNSVHLSPRSFSHFFDWWSMFSGNMSLPIRQGTLWPGPDKSSKKFGRHLATIKYNLLLSPLYLSHIYKHKDPEDYGQNVVSATGLKVKLDSFMLDLHQRREEFLQIVQGKQAKTTGMRINQAQLDFIHADVRAVSQTIKGTTSEDLDEATEETLASYEQSVPKADLSCFTIPDNDTDWVDMDDFVELDWILPAESNPETKILPLAFAPRFTYFRQTDHHNVISGDPMRSSAFGNEDTHFCVMSARNDPRRVQCDLIQERLERISEQISHNQRTIGEQELKVVREAQGQGQNTAKLRLAMFQHHHDVLQKKQKFLQAMHKVLLARLEDNDFRAVPDMDDAVKEVDEFFEAHEQYDPTDPEVLGMDSAPLGDDISDFNNRFIVHNAQLKWTNSLRNIILRYMHQVSQRRGFVYYMSRKAVKFILDIVEEQQSKARSSREQSGQQDEDDGKNERPSAEANRDDEVEVQDRIEQIIQDGKRFVEVDDSEPEDKKEKKNAANAASEEISREFTPQNAYHFRLVAPQIQLQSEKNTKAAALITSKGMQLKVIQIMDKDRVTDDVSGLVQRRFTAAMDSIQVFVTSTKTFSNEFLDMYSANRYGAKAGSSWPPWVPLEVMFDFNVDPYGFSRVVQRTSASMRFDKFNTLRLKYNDDVTSGQSRRSQSDPAPDENRMDHLWVDFPRLLAKCDSGQYYALYIIVLDLLLYSEPLEKTRSERLEKIMLASDFSDLSEAPEMITKLQEKIRTLQEIKMLFQINEKTLTRQQWKERIVLEQDLTACEDELFFIMKAITTSQRKYDERGPSDQATGLLRWEIGASELVWHLVRTAEESLVELQLKNAKYNRIDNNDGSNDNVMEIEKIEGWNLLPDAMYPQIIAPFEEKDQAFSEAKDSKMLRVSWLMLEAIAGIPVMERFEVNLYPLKIQLEREVGAKVFEYVFPGMSSGDKNGDTSPFMVKHILPSHQEEEDEESGQSTGHSSPVRPDHAGTQTRDSLSGAGDLSLRLQPTLTLPDTYKPGTKSKSTHTGHTDLLRIKHLGTSGPDLRRFTGRPKTDRSETSSLFLRPDNPSRQNSTMSSINGSKKEGEISKRFTLHRTNTDTSKVSKDKAARSDDLTQMLGRASKYMTLAYVRIPSMVLCLSYKGKGQRNIITDVHDLVFRMPTLEYTNKTWSNYDLFMQLKKEVVRALISHAGAIVGNKFHRPNRQAQSRLREIATSSVIMGSQQGIDNGGGSGLASESASTRGLSILEETESEPRQSFTSGRGSTLSSQYPDSMSSSFHSEQRKQGLVAEAVRSSSPHPNGGRPWTAHGGTTTPSILTTGSDTLVERPGSSMGPEVAGSNSISTKDGADSIRSALSRRLTNISYRTPFNNSGTSSTAVDESEEM
jgi:Mitochondrial protein from FMP27/Golgi-body localisation protein domain/RNA pol II promoter Fmp27 protein domain/Domain of unknown function (DUF2405)